MRALVGSAIFPRERNGAPLPSACRRVLEKCLTPPTLSEMAIYQHLPLFGKFNGLQGQGLAGRLNSVGGFFWPSPCVPNDHRSTSHFYRSKEHIVRTCSREMNGWKDETGQENSGGFYYARDDVRPAIYSGLQDPRQQNHRHGDLHEYCDP